MRTVSHQVESTNTDTEIIFFRKEQNRNSGVENMIPEMKISLEELNRLGWAKERICRLEDK